MKTNKVFLVVLLLGIIGTNIGSFFIGKQEATKELKKEKWEILNEVSDRYLRYFKSPETLEEQCAFEYIVHGECGEVDRMSEEQLTEYNRKIDSYYE